MCSDEPTSTDNTSNTGYDAKINTQNHLCLTDDETEVSGEVGGIQDGDTAPGAFPQFMQLPPELRHQIWHFYCPDLSVKARVLPVLNWPGSEVPSYPHSQTNLSIPPYHLLEDHTRNLRVTLSTHRESRSIAVRKYPDELVMGATPGTSIVRFRKETDVIFLLTVSTHVAYSVPHFGGIVQNLAVETVEDREDDIEEEDWLLTALPALKGLFPNLRRLFSYQHTQRWLPSRGDWMTHDCVHWYTAATTKYWEKPLEHTNVLYCWPDLDTYPDLVRSLVPRICSLRGMDKADVEFWPIVRFGSDISMRVYDMMSRQCLPSSEKGDDSSEAIDHDSEAIDHDEVMELLAS
ncbi:hypothetical protein E4U56_003333 [Claviceps arundinis]|uniref:2EXR domain-containing protein n=1 Tax=Claviceps arundinis TaxID=1623583 RepID=A0A9P7ST61_9HYPO|nr:hypothetical protein E4U56_003333 [Claviceps arundinis]